MFVDDRPAHFPDLWVGGINYPLKLADTGERVMGSYSAQAGRHVLPGELVHICDEFGYWRKGPLVTFLGRLDLGDYAYIDADGKRRSADWHVVRDVMPAIDQAAIKDLPA